jgi:hypothetical protein
LFLSTDYERPERKYVAFTALGLNRTGHMSFQTGQDRTPKFAGQVLLDRTKSGLIFFKHFIGQAGDINSHKISSLYTNLVYKMLIDKITKEI